MKILRTLIFLLCAAGLSANAAAQPPVPSKVVFAGQTIMIDNQERYERLDRELLSFTYMHTTSTLMLKRSERWFRQVVPILRQYGIPEDLKYLMVIESNLDPKAYSSAGAAGLWQFTKATGKEYGLEISSEVDERYNTAKATEAACRYLKKAYDKYGDWMTVAASYNAGQNGISQKIEQQKQMCALDLWLVEETSRYMYRLMAVKMMFENPEAFGFSIRAEDRYPYIAPAKTVMTNGSIEDLVQFALDNGVTYAALKRENLWLRDSKLTNPTGKTYKIAIPAL